MFYHGKSQSLTVPNKSTLPALMCGEGFCTGLGIAVSIMYLIVLTMIMKMLIQALAYYYFFTWKTTTCLDFIIYHSQRNYYFIHYYQYCQLSSLSTDVTSR